MHHVVGGGHGDHVGMGVFLERHIGAVTRAVERLIPPGGDDEVESETLKVHRQRVTAADGFCGPTIAVKPEVAARPTLTVLGHHFNIRNNLKKEEGVEFF